MENEEKIKKLCGSHSKALFEWRKENGRKEVERKEIEWKEIEWICIFHRYVWMKGK